jgi:hypothetical protein
VICSTRDNVVERHGYVGTEHPLDVHHLLRSQVTPAPIDMGLKLNTLIVHATQGLERKDLESSRVSEERPWPCHELVETAESPNGLFARAYVQMIGVRQKHRGPDSLQIER